MVTLKDFFNILKVDTCTFAKKFASASILLFMLLIIPIKANAYSTTDGSIVYDVFSSNKRMSYYTKQYFNSTDNVYITLISLSNAFANYDNSLNVGEKFCFNLNHTITFTSDIYSFDNVHSLDKYLLDSNNFPILNLSIDGSAIFTDNIISRFYKYDVISDINTKSITSDIYFSITNYVSTSYKIKDINGLSFLFKPSNGDASTLVKSRLDLSPYSNLRLDSNLGSHRINYFKLMSCDEAPFKEVSSSSGSGGDIVSSTLLLVIALGVFSVFLYLVIKDIFRK